MASVSTSPQKFHAILSSFIYESDRTVGDKKNKTPNKATNYDDFLIRVKSFTSLTWFAKPSWLSPPNCARYGWKNVSTDVLQCVTCKTYISGRLPQPYDVYVYDECCKKLEESLHNGHNICCSWANNPSPVSFLSIQFSESDIEKFQFINNVHKFADFKENLPVISSDIYNDLNLPSAAVDGLKEMVSGSEDDEVALSACIMVLCGWRIRNETNLQEACCDKCFRQIGFWNFITHKTEDDNSAQNEQPTSQNSQDENRLTEIETSPERRSTENEAFLESRSDENDASVESRSVENETCAESRSVENEASVEGRSSVNENSHESRSIENEAVQESRSSDDKHNAETTSEINGEALEQKHDDNVKETTSPSLHSSNSDKNATVDKGVFSVFGTAKENDEEDEIKTDSRDIYDHGKTISNQQFTDSSGDSVDFMNRITEESPHSVAEYIIDMILSQVVAQCEANKSSQTTDVGKQNKLNKRPHEDTEDDIVAEQNRLNQQEPQRKKMKCVDHFHPLNEHRPWCAWITSDADIISQDCSCFKQAASWRRLLHILLPQMQGTHSKTPHHDNLRSIRRLFMDWESPILHKQSEN